MRSEQQLMDEARGVDGACNASGLVHSLSRAMTDLWALARERGLGTDWVNRHPVLTLYLSQLNAINAYGEETLWDAMQYLPPSAVTELADAVSVLRQDGE